MTPMPPSRGPFLEYNRGFRFREGEAPKHRLHFRSPLDARFMGFLRAGRPSKRFQEAAKHP